ncbi:MAG: TonB-dependent receptor, partial [Gammaproteobacteria bacterium]
VPPELMAGVDVYKNPSAEQTEGGISGLVNQRTALPFDVKGFKGALTYQASYSTLREGKATPSASVLLSNRWNTPIGEVGALVDLASSDSHTRTDSLALDAFYPHDNLVAGRRVWVPRTALWRSMQWERDRKGGYAALQWRPMRDLTASLTYFKSKYDEGWSERSLMPSFGDGDPHRMDVTDAVYDDQGVFQSGTMYLRDGAGKRVGVPFAAERRVSQRNSSTTDVNLSLQWRPSQDWTIKTDFQKVKADTEGFDSTVADGFMLPSQTLDLTGEYPKLVFSDADRAFLAEPANYYWVHQMEHKDRSNAKAKAWRADVKYDFDHPVLRDVRFGVRLTERESVNNRTVPDYNWSAITPAWMRGWRITDSARLTDTRFPLGKETAGFSFPNFFNGDVNVPSVIFPNDVVAMNYPDSYNELHSYYLQMCRDRNGSNPSSCPTVFRQAAWLTDPAGENSQSEKTGALYTQLRFGLDQLPMPIDGNIGLRYVKTDSTAHGYTVYRPNPLNFGNGVTVVGADKVPNIANFAQREDFENSYSRLLPTLNLRIKASDTLQFRLALGRSMARPEFSSLQANTTLSRVVNQSTVEATKTATINSVTLGGGAAGNPNLRPTMANSLDITGEWYYAKASSLTGALFYKKLKDIVVGRNFNFALQDVNGTTHQFLVTGPVNGANGYARGAELAFQHYFDSLPGLFKGLGVQSSFTFVDSKRTLKDPVANAWCTGGQSADNFNIAVNGCDTDGRSFSDLPLVGL